MAARPRRLYETFLRARKTANLSESIHQQLNMYALAGSRVK